MTAALLLCVWSQALTAEWRWSDVFTPGTILPLFGHHPKVRESLGDEPLQPPYGVTPGYFYQRLDIDFPALHFDNLRLSGGQALPAGSGPWLDPALRPARRSHNVYEQANLRLDAWLLPMLNIFYVRGDGNGRTVVDGEAGGQPVAALFEYPFSVRSSSRGLSLAYAKGPWWTAISAVHSRVHGHSAGQLVFALQPRLLGGRFGWAGPAGWGLWLGVAHLHMGRISGQLHGLDWLQQSRGLRDAGMLPDLLATAPVAPLDVDFRGSMQAQAHWSYILGLGWSLAASLSLQMELGVDAAGGRMGLLDLQWRPHFDKGGG